MSEQANKRSKQCKYKDEHVAKYFHLEFWLFWTIVPCLILELWLGSPRDFTAHSQHSVTWKFWKLHRIGKDLAEIGRRNCGRNERFREIGPILDVSKGGRIPTQFGRRKGANALVAIFFNV